MMAAGVTMGEARKEYMYPSVLGLELLPLSLQAEVEADLAKFDSSHGIAIPQTWDAQLLPQDSSDLQDQHVWGEQQDTPPKDRDVQERAALDACNCHREKVSAKRGAIEEFQAGREGEAEC